MDLALVGVAAQLRLDTDGNVCKEARIALGAVAPTPIRARGAEETLIDKVIDEKLVPRVPGRHHNSGYFDDVPRFEGRDFFGIYG